MYQLSEKLLEHIDHFKEKETRKNDAALFFFCVRCEILIKWVILGDRISITNIGTRWGLSK